MTHGAGLELRLRVRHAAAALAYLAVSLPLGVVSVFAVIAALLTSLLGVLHVGTPVRAAALAACRRLADRDRRAANALLDAHVPPLPQPQRADRTRLPGRPDALADRQRTRLLILLAIKLPWRWRRSGWRRCSSARPSGCWR